MGDGPSAGAAVKKLGEAFQEVDQLLRGARSHRERQESKETVPPGGKLPLYEGIWVNKYVTLLHYDIL